MKHVMALAVCAAMIMGLAGTAGAVQIDWRGLDTDTGLDWSAGNFSPVFLWDISSGRPDYTKDPVGSRPSFISAFNFQYTGSGGGGGGGFGPGGGSPIGGGDVGDTTVDMRYNLVLNKDTIMDFATLFYDRDYGTRNNLQAADVALRVRMIDSKGDPAQYEAWRDITVGDLAKGVYAKWNILALAGAEVFMEVLWVEGDGVGAAGFFIDNVDHVIPEPATLALIATGLAGTAAMKRRRRA
jgi:hypothetical protein